ncbi:cell division protein FtsQ/DivIB [Pseudomonas typographi]|uniref:Cell division protein FtsQ n=1 Tax=Pseudomonas typographi TaxID=2715964 RepID=A0ABR7YW64_9PSED|nr:cell division protein FtsQ/DivIB [Pseudomonas typographi]MBD1553280.1 cell division protein FtsQ/DivIB [Pseudomonas typographi]MBD1585645.1 cell division protein FtsQ/DivIB [Pseudomonas typographi]MBD1597442.1 cell division protein FtsQ/DivIB [Pseudomonas typographi]
MRGASIRHQQPLPSRKAPPRGASRMVAKEPLSARLPRPGTGWLKKVLWPLLLAGLGVGTWYGTEYAMPYIDRPITHINVQGDLSYISQEAVQQRVAPYMNSRFFSIDLNGLSADLQTMPWIAHAEVRRVWPDQVVIRLEEQLPVARWGDDQLLNNQGEAFAPRELANYEHLPQLFGPQRAQQQVMQQYQVLSQMLRPLGFSIARLELRERGSWFLTTGAGSAGPGIELLLGRDHLVEKLRRFIAIYDRTLKEQITNIARIDLRYANGLAVGWRDPSLAIPAQGAVAKN